MKIVGILIVIPLLCLIQNFIWEEGRVAMKIVGIMIVIPLLCLIQNFIWED